MTAGWNIDRGEPLDDLRGRPVSRRGGGGGGERRGGGGGGSGERRGGGSEQGGGAGGRAGGQRTGGRRAEHAGTPAPRDGVLRVGRQTQGRGGKGVTVVTGLTLTGDELQRLARELKQHCGAGGTVRDGVVELQGDHRDALVEELRRRGFAARRAGG